MIRFLLALMLPVVVLAHPMDTSQLRVRLAPDQVELRFTLNLLSVSRIVAVDADHDQKITLAELDHAVPAVTAFLTKNVLVTLNDEDADIGTLTKHEAVWPNAATEPVTDRDASQRYADFTFVRAWPKGVHELWLGFQIFSQLGDQHTVQAIYQQPGEPDEEVVFTQFEPDYLFDTGWGDKPPQPSPPATAAISNKFGQVPLRTWLAGSAALLAAAVLAQRWWRERQQHR